MKGIVTFTILESLREGPGFFSDLFTAYLSAGYGASFGKLEYERRKAEDRRLKRKIEREEENQKKEQCRKMIYYLTQSGLIVKKNDIFKITKKGKEKQKKLKEKLLKSLPTIDYPRIKSNKFILISFDVPEKERRKRAWLRDVLKYFDFQMVHQSAWVGFTAIPEEFIEDLSRIGLADKVEIIEVASKGTLLRRTI